MPYAADYSGTYKDLIKSYWEAQIDSGYGGDALMKTQLNTFLNNISSAEANYITEMNRLDTYNSIRFRWQYWFGLFNLYVFYKHCIEFPVAANLPSMIDGLIPWPSGVLGGSNDDLRSFFTPWRYIWSGDGAASNPWFTLSPGSVIETASQEVTKMITAFNNSYPVDASHYTNPASYALGATGDSEIMATISDSSPACRDYDRFARALGAYDNHDYSNYGVIDRMREFLGPNYSFLNYGRYKIGKTITNYLAAGGSISVVDKPKDWMLAHGGQEIVDYMGWTDINGNIL
jgi:hypothetical protein